MAKTPWSSYDPYPLKTKSFFFFLVSRRANPEPETEMHTSSLLTPGSPSLPSQKKNDSLTLEAGAGSPRAQSNDALLIDTIQLSVSQAVPETVAN